MNKSEIKILCVDDEPDILEILKYNLSNEGYQISTAKDGKIAVKKAKETHPNLIIMDIMMPNMDGIEACEILRSDEGFNDTLIMFLTGVGSWIIYGFNINSNPILIANIITFILNLLILISKLYYTKN